jgi:hypothetical protein
MLELSNMSFVCVPTCKTFSAPKTTKAKREEGPTVVVVLGWMIANMAVMKRPFKHLLNIFMEDNWAFHKRRVC